jgi:hypothetical protein
MLKHFQQDFPASIVVFLVALPLCLGIALASGAPPLAGLIAGVLGGIVVGSISGSHVGVSGPAAGLAVIVFNGIQSLPSYETFLLAVLIGGFVHPRCPPSRYYRFVFPLECNPRDVVCDRNNYFPQADSTRSRL